MPNANYVAGRAFEYERVAHWQDVMGYTAFRTAGSHSPWDVIAVHPDKGVILIQCKRYATQSALNRALESFKTQRGVTGAHVRFEGRVKGASKDDLTTWSI